MWLLFIHNVDSICNFWWGTRICVLRAFPDALCMLVLLRGAEVLGAVIAAATMFFWMAFADLSCLTTSAEWTKFSIGCSHFPFIIFYRNWETVGENVLADNVLASAETGRFFIEGKGGVFFLLEIGVLYRLLQGLLDRQYGRPSKLAQRWKLRSARICTGTRMPCVVKFVLFRNRRQWGVISTSSVNDEAKRSLVFELGPWSAIPNRGSVDEDCVVDVFAESALTWATAVDFWELLRSLLFSRWLLHSVVLSEFLDELHLYASWSKMLLEVQVHKP